MPNIPDLPSEVLLQILSGRYLSKPELVNAAQACRVFQSVAIPALDRSLRFAFEHHNTWTDARRAARDQAVHELFKSLNLNGGFLASCVHSLTLRERSP